MEILSAIVGALIGSIASAIFALYYGVWEQKRRRKLETTISLYEEFHSKYMLHCRIKASRILKENLSNDCMSYNQLYENLSVEEWLPVSSFLHFFEKLSTYYEKGYLDNELTEAFFSTYFTDYYDSFLMENNKVSREREKGHIISSIDKLGKWLYKQRSREPVH